MPEDVRAALDAEPAAGACFEGLSNSLRRYHIGNVDAAKAVATRERRVARMIELFWAGKQR